MPQVTIVNDTQLPLHIALRHISPLHFVNNVPPGGEAVFKHVGRVWFTIEARIARSASEAAKGSQDDQAPQEKEAVQKGKKKEEHEDEGLRARLHRAKENNEYTMLQTVAAPVAVSVAALSLGAGAIYLGAAASAAGGMSAAVSSISASASSLGASAAAKGPTVQRLYKYAMKGYQVAQIGQVVGIGGKALADSTKSSDDKKEGGEKQKSDAISASVSAVRQTLGYLVTQSAVKSHGWYMKKDRTFRIRGGPKAAELENWVIIETDTVEPFEVVSDDPSEKQDPAAEQEALQHEEKESA